MALGPSRPLVLAACLAGGLLLPPLATAQSPAPSPAPAARPAFAAGGLNGSFKLDGILDDEDWKRSQGLEGLVMSEPTPGAAPERRTTVKVLADRTQLLIGVRCDESDPAAIVSFTKARDASLQNEDHVKVVLDTFQDEPLRLRLRGEPHRGPVRRARSTRAARRRTPTGTASGRPPPAATRAGGAWRSGFPVSTLALQARPARRGTSTCSGESSGCRRPTAGRAGAATTRSRRRAGPAGSPTCRTSTWASD